MKPKFTYKDSGVDVEMAENLTQLIEDQAKQTQDKNQLLGDFKLFASVYDLSSYQSPLLVTGCDGVGTKLELLLHYDLLEVAGKDLVAMNVNDVLTTGANPLLFQDYIAMGRVKKEVISRLISGMTDYLSSCACILSGGETAEMPDLVKEGFVELSGFCVGCVEKERRIDPKKIQEGDVLIAYPSVGFHSNGWSLVRRILKENPDLFTDDEMRDLLVPTPLYWKEVLAIRESGVFPQAMAHITGGGLPKNVGRLFSSGLGADLQVPAWKNSLVDRVLDFVDGDDCWTAFNMGVGWVVIVRPEDLEAVLGLGNGGFYLGEVSSEKGVRIQVSNLQINE